MKFTDILETTGTDVDADKKKTISFSLKAEDNPSISKGLLQYQLSQDISISVKRNEDGSYDKKELDDLSTVNLEDKLSYTKINTEALPDGFQFKEYDETNKKLTLNYT
ncbi:MAG: hypothetical protein GXP45_02645 [bacterium]|nr:hypothetical protein [bacterium]